MPFSEDVLVRIMIFVLGLAGFTVAKHIRDHKVKNAPLVCPVGFDCHSVVHSDYSKFLGMPVEVLGMFYYALLALSYLFFIFLPNSLPTDLIGLLVALSLVAFLFSVYLIIAQIFILRKGCSWCIVSAIICFLVFVLTILHYDLGLIAQIFVK